MKVVINNINGEINKRKPPNKYSIRVRLAPNKHHNQWHWSKCKTVYGNKNEARAELVKYGQQLEDEANERIITLRELCDMFTENRIALNKVKLQTIKHEIRAEKHICSILGKNRIDELTPRQIENAYVKLQNKGCSKNVIFKVHLKLKQILRYAENNDLIVSNPAAKIEGITAPKRDEIRHDLQMFTNEQVSILSQDLLSHAFTGKRLTIWLALTTGMRQGEILGLKWIDLNFDTMKLHVRRQYNRYKTFDDPKTQKSNRIISLDTKTIEILRKWKSYQMNYCSNTLEMIWEKSLPICSNEAMNHISALRFTKWRQKYFVSLGIAHFKYHKKIRDRKSDLRNHYWGYVGPTFHALRHYHATMLVGSGIDPKTAQERLGHEDVRTTLQIYADVQKGNDAQAVVAVNNMLEDIC